MSLPVPLWISLAPRPVLLRRGCYGWCGRPTYPRPPSSTTSTPPASMATLIQSQQRVHSCIVCSLIKWPTPHIYKVVLVYKKTATDLTIIIIIKQEMATKQTHAGQHVMIDNYYYDNNNNTTTIHIFMCMAGTPPSNRSLPERGYYNITPLPPQYGTLPTVQSTRHRAPSERCHTFQTRSAQEKWR